jgi:4-azaleucine resistance transporter AzlC
MSHASIPHQTTSRHHTPRQQSIWYFSQGVRAGLPIALGYFPTALAFGVVALAAGLTAAQAMLMSLLVFSGAGQFLAVNLIAGGAAPMAIVTANLVVNLRYFVMSASLSRRLRLSWLEAALIGFGVTDETFIMNYLAHPREIIADEANSTNADHEANSKDDILPTDFALGVSVVSYLGWIGGTYVGVVFASVLPPGLTIGMGVVLYAMFIALLIPTVAKSLGVGVIAIASGGCCWLFSQYLSFGWAMILATTIVAGFGVWHWGEGVDRL